MGSHRVELIAAELGSDWPPAAVRRRVRASMIDGPVRRAGRGGACGVCAAAFPTGFCGRLVPAFAAASLSARRWSRQPGASPGLDWQFQDEPHFCGALGTPTVSDLPCFRANSVPVIKHMGGGGEGGAFNVVLFLHKQTPMHTLSLATVFLSFFLTFFR